MFCKEIPYVCQILSWVGHPKAANSEARREDILADLAWIWPPYSTKVFFQLLFFIIPQRIPCGYFLPNCSFPHGSLIQICYILYIYRYSIYILAT